MRRWYGSGAVHLACRNHREGLLPPGLLNPRVRYRCNVSKEPEQVPLDELELGAAVRPLSNVLGRVGHRPLSDRQRACVFAYMVSEDAAEDECSRLEVAAPRERRLTFCMVAAFYTWKAAGSPVGADPWNRNRTRAF